VATPGSQVLLPDLHPTRVADEVVSVRLHITNYCGDVCLATSVAGLDSAGVFQGITPVAKLLDVSPMISLPATGGNYCVLHLSFSLQDLI